MLFFINGFIFSSINCARDAANNKNNTNLCSRSEFLLFAASRAQLMEEKIKPLIKNNNVIIYDRFIDSSVVYQGIVRGLDINFIKEVNYFATSGFVPNITFYLDLDPEIGLQRINENNREKNRLDLESILFHQNVRNGYLYLCEKEKERIKKIDANQKPNEILKDILKELKK